jgi:G:T-mismatch repair DNA endonuclease (very short patch repair protein)
MSRVPKRPVFSHPCSSVASPFHSCPKHANCPVNNEAFWKRKLLANKRRDRLVSRTLRKQGWAVLRVWEHELRRREEAKLLRRIAGVKSEIVLKRAA